MADASQDTKTDRRSFMKGAAVAGLTGAAGMAFATQSAAAAQETAQETTAENPQAPAGLRPGAEPDSRFPVFYQRSVPEGMRLLVDYFTALSQRDLDGMAQTLHYPFVTYEGSNPVVIDSADKFMATPPPSMNVTGNGDNLIRPGSYDIMEGIELHIYNPLGAGFSLNYSRYRADGHKLYGVNGIYGVTNNDGKWGIEFMSTIFQPANQLRETYDADAALRAVHDLWREHDLGRKHNDAESLVRFTHFPFTNVIVFIGGSSANSGPARAGRPMEPYRIQGVKSRLRFEPATPQEKIDHPDAATLARAQRNGDQFLKLSGSSVGKWYQSLEFPGPDGKGTRVLAANTEKAHTYSGYSRYADDGTLISETRYISACIFKNDRWFGTDITYMFGQQMYRDHTNDAVSA